MGDRAEAEAESGGEGGGEGGGGEGEDAVEAGDFSGELFPEMRVAIFRITLAHKLSM